MIRACVSFTSLLLLCSCPAIDLAAQCRDGRLNGPETDLDCGGGCGPCEVGKLCLGDGDCASEVCTLNRCAAPSCLDGIRNQDELGTDCGGACPPCGGGVCAAENGTQDGAETGVDCGGPCPPCGLGAGCLRNADCAMGVCLGGRCTTGTCAAPLEVCGGACVDPRVDRANCGGCGRPCVGDEACVGGACRAVCTGGTLACGAQCVDVASDPLHCGSCTRACSSDELCVGGNCFAACPPQQALCGGLCVTTDRDPLHCGGCGRPCAPGSGCVNSQCVPGCAAPLLACNGGSLCVDPRWDPLHCGGCGMPCPAVPNARAACTPMGCTRSVCQPGFDDCNGMAADGCEAELQLDPSNCGACGRACFGQQMCVLGRCCGPLPAGSYQATCTNCEACNGVLSCLCDDAMQIPRATSIPLGSCPNFTNCNGVLLCNGC